MTVPNAAHLKSKFNLTRIVKAFGYSLSGLRYAWGEAAFRQELMACVVLVPIAFWLPVTRYERLAMLSSLLLVLLTEILNSALEAIVDKTTPEIHELAKKAKDLGSAAVFLAMLMVIGVWATVLMPRGL